MRPISEYWDLFAASFKQFAEYTWAEITFAVEPWYVNYFWWLVLLSIVVWGLEILFPWRKDQAIIRKDFWLDAFYMFFNFYIFKIIIFFAFSNLTEAFFSDILGGDVSRYALIDIGTMPGWLQLVVFFVATDFIQWFTHVLLHRYEFLWRFH
ncbi:MAG: sterol desaturase, partial [Flavobacteriales bacterium]|nr:sterol desaturase [Flavobacteriales bacterium]